MKPPPVWTTASVLLVVAATLACGGADGKVPTVPASGAPVIQLTSPAFVEGSPIPVTYTCDGDDLSPPLSWNSVPEGSQSVTLIVDDPDAPGGTWAHWVLYAISPDANGLPEGIQSTGLTSSGGISGSSDFKRLGYGGPCPPGGDSHHYFFKLYALDTRLDLDRGATKMELVDAMSGHILAERALIGTYRRR